MFVRALLPPILVLASAGGPFAAASAAPKRRPARADRVVVAAGTFVKGGAGHDDERPRGAEKLRAFRIDRHEVTRERYASCVAAGRCAPPPGVDLRAEPELPVTQVTWQEARDYCRFAGGRLPSEAEWEKAARGSDGREFPWGAEADCTRANWGNYDGEGPCAAQNPGQPVPVGRHPSGASVYGALDMAGNVWEWVEDAYEGDPARKGVRGGSCCSYFVEPRASNRNGWAADHRDGDLGFRCVAR